MAGASKRPGGAPNWSAHPTLAASRAWSLETCDQIRAALQALGDELPAVRSVILTGSLARLDACSLSDVDLIVVLEDGYPLATPEASQAVASTWDRLLPLGLRAPNLQGVFATPTSRAELCDGPRGIVDEAVAVFGKRIQILLEATPVYGAEPFESLQAQILERYRDHPFSERDGETWSYLTDDLIRYWRSYRVWRHWDLDSDNGGWFLRNLKLRHSRLLTYASVLLACSASESSAGEAAELLTLLRRTPLERLWWLEQQSGGDNFERICRHYDRFLAEVTSPEVRDELESCRADSDAARMEAPSAFTELMQNAEELRTALVALLRQLPEFEDDRALARLIF